MPNMLNRFRWARRGSWWLQINLSKKESSKVRTVVSCWWFYAGWLWSRLKRGWTNLRVVLLQSYLSRESNLFQHSQLRRDMGMTYILPWRNKIYWRKWRSQHHLILLPSKKHMWVRMSCWQRIPLLKWERHVGKESKWGSTRRWKGSEVIRFLWLLGLIFLKKLFGL